nr:MAG TPA: portal protein [Caudoviricetes sp.]
MGLIMNLWRRVQSMFEKTDLKQVIGGEIELTAQMIDSIDLWQNMLTGAAPWTNKAPSLGLEIGICREFADVAINEMEAKVEGNDTLDQIFQTAVRDLNENLQDGLALGSLIIKPLMGGQVEYITADNFIPVRFDNGRPVDCVFIERKQLNENKFYHRLERHTLTPAGLTITNRAYVSTSSSKIGTPVSLDAVTDWADLPEEISYPGMTKIDFGYYRNPLKNRLDNSQCGVSAYSGPAIDRIKSADIQAARLDWEYESGERAIHVDERALKTSLNGKKSVAKSHERLYRGLNIDQKNDELFKEYNPQMRDDSYRQGLETALRQVEFSVGLAYGDLSDAQYVEKTATEIKAAKQRKYNRVTAIQENLKACLEDLVDALAFYNSSYTTTYSLSCAFNDSILTDEEAERNQDRQDVSMGVQRLEEYRSKWYGEDLETALQNLPEQAGSVIDNLPPEE